MYKDISGLSRNKMEIRSDIISFKQNYHKFLTTLKDKNHSKRFKANPKEFFNRKKKYSQPELIQLRKLNLIQRQKPFYSMIHIEEQNLIEIHPPFQNEINKQYSLLPDRASEKQKKWNYINRHPDFFKEKKSILVECKNPSSVLSFDKIRKHKRIGSTMIIPFPPQENKISNYSHSKVNSDLKMKRNQHFKN